MRRWNRPFCCSPTSVGPTTNVSHIWRNHLAFVEDRLNAPVSESNDTWIKRFLAGAFVGGGWTEANNVTLTNLVTTITAEDDH